MSAIRHAVLDRETSVPATPSVGPGKSHPLGATCVDGGVNFSVFSRGSTRMDLTVASEVTRFSGV